MGMWNDKYKLIDCCALFLSSFVNIITHSMPNKCTLEIESYKCYYSTILSMINNIYLLSKFYLLFCYFVFTNECVVLMVVGRNEKKFQVRTELFLHLMFCWKNIVIWLPDFCFFSYTSRFHEAPVQMQIDRNSFIPLFLYSPFPNPSSNSTN